MPVVASSAQRSAAELSGSAQRRETANRDRSIQRCQRLNNDDAIKFETFTTLTGTTVASAEPAAACRVQHLVVKGSRISSQRSSVATTATEPPTRRSIDELLQQRLAQV